MVESLVPIAESSTPSPVRTRVRRVEANNELWAQHTRGTPLRAVAGRRRLTLCFLRDYHVPRVTAHLILL